MKLKDYLEMKGIKPYNWIRGTSISQGSVYSWLRGEAKPTLDRALQIQKMTDGAVRPEDWET